MKNRMTNRTPTNFLARKNDQQIFSGQIGTKFRAFRLPDMAPIGRGGTEIEAIAVDNELGYIIVSDQAANKFRIYPREGEAGNPHSHSEIKVFNASTNESDGSEVTSTVVDDELVRAPNGVPPMQ